ncbi:hypothetical protein ACHAPE_000019 [Trichoderma viride]
MPHAELPPGMWSVRTIDDSPSHQAEVVICDWVRTEKPGFLTADERLAVMTTRAQALTILVGKKSILTQHRSRTLANLFEYAKAQRSIITVKGWKQAYNLHDLFLM